MSLARKLKCFKQNKFKTLKAMLELRKRYIELKQKAKQLMLDGKMNQYIEMLTEIEQLNLIIVKANR